jgi:hypothetical protein
MPSQSEQPNYDLLKEAETLQAIAVELQRLADEATERWRAAVARIEGAPLFDRLDDNGR